MLVEPVPGRGSVLVVPEPVPEPVPGCTEVNDFDHEKLGAGAW